MKKIISIVLSIVMVMSISFSASAINTSTNFTYSLENTTITFDESTPFSETSRLNLANIIVYGQNNTQTYGLMCTLLGHKYTTDYVTTITHNVCESQPKCLREVMEIGECSRCGDTYTDVINSQLVTCCS